MQLGGEVKPGRAIDAEQEGLGDRDMVNMVRRPIVPRRLSSMDRQFISDQRLCRTTSAEMETLSDTHHGTPRSLSQIEDTPRIMLEPSTPDNNIYVETNGRSETMKGQERKSFFLDYLADNNNNPPPTSHESTPTSSSSASPPNSSPSNTIPSAYPLPSIGKKLVRKISTSNLGAGLPNPPTSSLQPQTQPSATYPALFPKPSTSTSTGVTKTSQVRKVDLAPSSRTGQIGEQSNNLGGGGMPERGKTKEEMLMGMTAAEMGLRPSMDVVARSTTGTKPTRNTESGSEGSHEGNWGKDANNDIKVQGTNTGLRHRTHSSTYLNATYLPVPPITFADRKLMLISALEGESGSGSEVENVVGGRTTIRGRFRSKNRQPIQGVGVGGMGMAPVVGAGKRSRKRIGLTETEEERRAREGESVIAWKVSFR